VKSNSQNIKLEESWKNVLLPEFSKSYMQTLKGFLISEKNKGKIIYPKSDEIFAAMNATSFERVRVVIIGQDPYHGPGQAHGLSFSVKPGVQPPPSLVNIFKELESDLGMTRPKHGCLQRWADQGVLLLNAVLTVEGSLAASHQKRGWEEFTDKIVEKLNQEHEGLAFLLWGAYAQKKGANIDRKKHLVLESVHPSPLSSHRGFFGSKPFSKINHWLISKGQEPIDWQL
jgi:uracil-DNA glycosylase